MRGNIDEMVAELIRSKSQSRENKSIPFLVAIDGRCGSGKTTLAKSLQERITCSVIHMDDFFLRPEQRTAQRYQQAGGNVDYERVQQEVLLPIQEGGRRNITFAPFDCQTFTLMEERSMQLEDIVIVEGSYSCHPKLIIYYDWKIFMTVSEEEQLRRIERRNGSEKLQMFRDKWIPYEEFYFETYGIAEQCDGIFDNEEEASVWQGK